MADMLRYNQGKPQLALVPTSFILTINPVPFGGPMKLIRDVAQVLTFGATKYAMNNWRQGGSWIGTLNSGMRHADWYIQGEQFDSESNLHHLAHLGCNLAFLLEFIDQETPLDDRYPLKQSRRVEATPSDAFPQVISDLLVWKDGGGNEVLDRAIVKLSRYYETLNDAPSTVTAISPLTMNNNSNTVLGNPYKVAA